MWGFTGNRKFVHVKHVDGSFQRLHRASGVVLQALLFVVPWLTYDGRPLVRFDLPGRKFFLFGQVFVASEGFDLVLIGLLAAFSLFFFTSLFGRVWCGYVCPQSVSLEEWIRPIEEWVEGDRATRLRREQGPWTGERIARRAVKLGLFALLAVVVSTTILSYFAGARQIWTGVAGPTDYALVGIFATGMFLDWAWFREQLCNYLCPYARFQGALADDHSLVVSYDRARGEPRGKGKASADAGHCIDCNKCVDVCPAGIDIRNGYQLECIACARCIDACETVMPKLGFPTLVRYSTVARDEGRITRLLRPRTAAYALILLVVSGALTYKIASHEPLEARVNRSPGSLFALDDDGGVRNTFLVQVTNNDPSESHLYVISVHGLKDVQMSAPPVELAPLQTKTVPLMVRVEAEHVDRTTPFSVHVTQVAAETPHQIELDATFKAPPRSGGEI
ncbi:MAG: cytochrome c oxidase accessory protein CcoG [Myxococcota bacterium]